MSASQIAGPMGEVFVTVAPMVTHTIAALAVVALLAYVLKSTVTSNLKAVQKWLSTMDITAHDQRFQGERCETLHTFYVERPSFGALTVKYLMKTKSGRYFDLEIGSEMSDVVHWHVDVVAPAAAVRFLSSLAALDKAPSTTA